MVATPNCDGIAITRSIYGNSALTMTLSCFNHLYSDIQYIQTLFTKKKFKTYHHYQNLVQGDLSQLGVFL